MKLVRLATPALAAVALMGFGWLGEADTEVSRAQGELSPDTWSLLVPDHPPILGREGASLVYDSKNQRFVLFGGQSTQYYSNETWVLDLADGNGAWSKLEPSEKAPSPRKEHVAVYDANSERMVVFGGQNHIQSLMYGDLWTLDLRKGEERWDSMVAPGIRPEARHASGGVYDPLGDRMILFGGNDHRDWGYGDTWALDLSEAKRGWSLIQGGIGPTARESMVAVYEPVAQSMIVHAGYEIFQRTYQSDTYRLGLTPPERWFSIGARQAPPARKLSAGAWDAANSRMLVYGGSNQNERLGDLWALEPNLQQWTMIHEAGGGPGRRQGHAMAYDAAGGRMLLFGGLAGDTREQTRWLADVWALQVVPDVPTPTATSTATATPDGGTPGTPSTPSTPSTPETPGSGTPGTPGTPGSGTPGTPETPGSGTPGSETPGTPGSGTPGTPGTPGSSVPTGTQPTPVQTSKVPTLTSTPETRRLWLPLLWHVPDPPPTPLPSPTATATALPCVVEEIEPNDGIAKARSNPPLCPDRWVYAQLPEGDLDDLYRIVVPHDGVLQVDLENPPRVDFDLYLYDDAAASPIGSSVQGGTASEFIELPVAAGTYFIRVFPLDGRSPQSYRVRWFIY